MDISHLYCIHNFIMLYLMTTQEHNVIFCYQDVNVLCYESVWVMFYILQFIAKTGRVFLFSIFSTKYKSYTSVQVKSKSCKKQLN